MNEFHRESAKTNTELLKIVASGITVLLLLLGNLLMKDNFGNTDKHYLYLTILIVATLIGLILSYQLYVSVVYHLNKIRND